MTARNESGHVPALDGVRGIAVLLVMFLHFTLIQPIGLFETAVARFMSMGWIGVDLFFVLSGFLITGILYDARNGAHFFRNFYLRRALRIFPLYYAFLVAILVILPFLAPSSMRRLDGAPWLWTYLGNFYFARVGWEGMPEHTVHLWSLAVEEQFYLIWPLVVFFLDRPKLLRVAIGSMGVAVLFRLVMQFTSHGHVGAYALLPARMDALALGGALALIVRGEQHSPHANVALARRLGLAGALLMVLAITVSVLSNSADGWLPALAPQTQIFGYLGTELASGALILLALFGQHARLNRLLTSKTLVAFGKYSYGLYLIHVPLRDVARSWIAQRGSFPTLFGSQLPGQLAIYMAGIGIAVVLALTSWNLFEKHFLKLKALFPYGSARLPERSTQARTAPALDT